MWLGVLLRASRSTDQVSRPHGRGVRLGSFHLSPSERPFSIAPFRVSVLQLRRGPGKNENRTLKMQPPHSGASCKHSLTPCAPILNQEIWEHYQDVSLDEIQALLTASHTQTVELIESFSDEELFTKKYFPWTGTTSLGSTLSRLRPALSHHVVV